MKPAQIISLLPFSKPFLFVDSIKNINENFVEGEYTFCRDEFFYKGHFLQKTKNGDLKNIPVTPGVILIETMAQIGLACLSIYLNKEKINTDNPPEFVLSSCEADFYLPVFPGEKVTVYSEKIYFRFGKLKCNVKMKNLDGGLVCKSIISGMIKDFSTTLIANE